MARQLRQFLAGVALLLTAGCGGSHTPEKPPETGPVRGGSLVASLRSEPGTFNRFAPGANSAAIDALTRLTHATLVRVNHATGETEPWLAERWTTSPDGRTMTFTLRDGVTFSDGVPFTSADVVFTFRALYDEPVGVLASAVRVQNKPLQVTAPDPRTVVVTLPAPFANAPALLDSVWIYPQHLLQSALDAHTFGKAWGLSTPPGSMAGLGPFVLREFVPNQRMTFTRNPHYWRKDASGAPLPYLDQIVVEIVKSMDAEMLRMQAGTIDVMTQPDLRAQDISPVRKLRDEGKLQLIDAGVSVDYPNMLWFNLTAEAEQRDQSAKPYLHRVEFRQAISYAVDRDDIVKTIYLGAAVPTSGPVTPGNRTWYSDAAPKYPHDAARAQALLAALGLSDRNGDGMLEDAAGKPVGFSIITQGGHIRETVSTLVQSQLKQVGIAVDVVPLDPGSLGARFGKGDYEAMYYGFSTSSLDPALTLDFWLSSGSGHVWNPEQKTPATPWERQIDDLMQKQAAAPTLAERKRLFADVQKILGEQLPVIAFVAPNLTFALSRRVGGAAPGVLDPKILWQADTLYAR